MGWWDHQCADIWKTYDDPDGVWSLPRRRFQESKLLQEPGDRRSQQQSTVHRKYRYTGRWPEIVRLEQPFYRWMGELFLLWGRTRIKPSALRSRSFFIEFVLRLLMFWFSLYQLDSFVCVFLLAVSFSHKKTLYIMSIFNHIFEVRLHESHSELLKYVTQAWMFIDINKQTTSYIGWHIASYTLRFHTCNKFVGYGVFLRNYQHLSFKWKHSSRK